MILIGSNGMRVEDDKLHCGCVIKHETTKRESNQPDKNGVYIYSRINYCPVHAIGPRLQLALEWHNDEESD